ncbi:unnamed protein product, partial [Discosporangium mesarthrocarpum]
MGGRMRSRIWIAFCLVTCSLDSASTNCDYTFANGDFPQFNLPEEVWDLVETHMNPGNPIVHASDLSPVIQCDGDTAAFQLPDGSWNTTIIGDFGVEYSFSDFFFAKLDGEVWVNTIEPRYNPKRLYQTLNNTIIRLNVTCGNNAPSCVEFTANLAGYVLQPFPYEGSTDCYHGFQNGEMAPMFQAHMAFPNGPSTASPLSNSYSIIESGRIKEGLG